MWTIIAVVNATRAGSEKKISSFVGFKPMNSVISVQCSTN